jgi:hypothetical protein
MDRRLDRRFVALAAAYAVVLNTLLPVLTIILPPVAMAESGLAVMCSAGGPASDGGVPEKPQPLSPCGAACAMPGCGTAVLRNDDPTVTDATGVSVGLVGLRLDGRRKQMFWLGGSKLARGPPIP